MWYKNSVQPIDANAVSAAREHQNQLTKPPRSLGELETIAEQFSGWQGKVLPALDAIQIRIFAGDHGVCAQNISAFPQAVTAQMILNFLHGGAAISVLSRQLNADFAVVNMGTVTPVESGEGLADLVQVNIGKGTADFSQEEAMSIEQLELALGAGRDQVHEDAHLFIGGEMGIGNTSAASAIYSALLKLPVELSVGPGTGLDDHGVRHKQTIIETSLRKHNLIDPKPSAELALDVLRKVGGFEIAGLVGAFIACAQKGVPILVDGFICTAAALAASLINPGVKDWMLFAHQSAEPAHQIVLSQLKAKPLLDLGMRLGEGSGAALAVPILQSALQLHNQMATFAQAGVSEG